ncbi:MAG: helix-turn-helix domain-containing protein [Geminicoccaceae bacterium]
MAEGAPPRGADLRDARVRAEIDRQVGARIMEYRRLLGLSRQAMASRIGISMGQLHKYETAVNRVSAGMLHRIAGALGVEVQALFDNPVATADAVELQGERRLRALLADVIAVRDPYQREAIFTLARAFSRCDQTSAAEEPVAEPPAEGEASGATPAVPAPAKPVVRRSGIGGRKRSSPAAKPSPDQPSLPGRRGGTL